MVVTPEPGFWKYWRQTLSLLKSQCHAIMNKYSEAAFAVKQVHEGLSNTENLTKCTLAKVGKNSVWTAIVNNAEENRAKFCNF
jgi:hypothetical protein